ncbi:GNAT family N-acetyltransferase [Paenibacillus sp. JX-17]|uniref:GNAT family N-acetyltransferase n=1 Tax=Paenibacillus lacisoli TaxID=3064525 RepID=A0ABT9C9I2_9BACL|nr:GNAT family N-acetyltransferase [Paenibacillus sp. JX-17]MDO7905909.1 GNAT family N-acetyltransferase [Paenibacillus sp. JX-17]
MFMNVKAQIREPEVMELLEYAVFPEPEQVETAVQSYESHDEYELYAYDDKELLVGLIGFEDRGEGLYIRHISVLPENRRKGYGRGMILELMLERNPELIIAETDEEGVDFYRSIGFMVFSMGEVYPGVERFRCEYEVEQADEEEQ